LKYGFHLDKFSERAKPAGIFLLAGLLAGRLRLAFDRVSVRLIARLNAHVVNSKGFARPGYTPPPARYWQGNESFSIDLLPRARWKRRVPRAQDMLAF
jgi:hypothetical protein